MTASLLLCACQEPTPLEPPTPYDDLAVETPGIAADARPAPAPPQAPVAPSPAPSQPWTPIRLIPVGPPGFTVRPEPESFGPTLRLSQVHAHQDMSDGAPVAVSQRGVHFGDATVARIENTRLVIDDLQGHLIARLLEPLAARGRELEAEAAARGEVSTNTIVIFAERSTTFSTIVDLLYTANRAGFREYQFAVDIGGTGLPVGAVLTVDPPKYSRTTKKPITPPGIRVFVEHRQVHLSRDGRRLAVFDFDHHDPAALQDLANLAADQAAALGLPDGEPATVLLSASPDVSIQRVLTVYAQMSGPGCMPFSMFASDRKKCFFPLRVVDAGK